MFIKIVILVVIAAVVAPFFIKGPDGEPLMTLSDLFGAEETAAGAEPTTVYKWQDENGVWQFSTEPVDVPGVETLELSGDINTMDAFRAPRGSGGSASGIAAGAANLPPGLTTVAPDQVSEMMDTVTNLQETVDQRKADMDAATDGRN